MSRGPRLLTETFLLRMTPEQRERWEKEARKAGVSLAKWIRIACDCAPPMRFRAPKR